jgi:hypothetical protein
MAIDELGGCNRSLTPKLRTGPAEALCCVGGTGAAVSPAIAFLVGGLTPRPARVGK